MHIILSFFEFIAMLSIVICLLIAIYILLLAMISDLGGKVEVSTIKKLLVFLLKSFVIFIISSGVFKLGTMIFL